MNVLKTKTAKLLAGTALAGASIAAVAVPANAAPAQAAPAPPAASSTEVGAGVDVSLDPVAIGNAIKDAVNDQKDRGGAVRAAMDVGFYNEANPDRLTVAVVNKNQDINVEGEIANAEHIDIKGGSYVVYWFSGPGKITNNGDQGWINWGAQGNIDRQDNVIHVNGG